MVAETYNLRKGVKIMRRVTKTWTWRVGLLLVVLAFPICLGCSVGLIGAETRMPVGEPQPAPEGPEWVDLLDADHASHWENVSDDLDIFHIEDGELHIPGRSTTRYVAYTHEAFEDFELHLEYRLGASTNSGVFIRSSLENPVYAGMEIQVLDDHGELPSTHTTGSLYDVATPMFNMSLPTGSWNSMRIRCEGPMLTVHMNGWKILEADLDQLTMPVGKFDTPLAELSRSGHLLLQDHGGEITYRNLLIRPL